MTKHGNRIWSSDTGGQDLQSNGWRMRAEQVHGELVPDPSRTLSASEIGSFTFCPQAWYLQRCRMPVTPDADARRQVGSRLHRDIGRQTTLVQAAGALQAALLVAIGLTLFLLVVLVLRWFG